MPGLSGEVGEIRIVGICLSRFNSFQTLYCKGRCIIREQSLGPLKTRQGKLGWESVDASRTWWPIGGDAGVSASKCGSLVSLGSALEKQNLCFSPQTHRIRIFMRTRCPGDTEVRSEGTFLPGNSPLLCDLGVSSLHSIPGSFIPGPGPFQ